jgi:dipeptidyl aminopeptidase/acylaminoacyl peptidase
MAGLVNVRSLCATLVALVGAAAGAPAAWATFPGPLNVPFPGLNGQLAYEAGSGATRNVFTIQPLAGSPTDVTPLKEDNARAPARDAAWSADGRRIAFMSERDGNPEIYVMNSDGSGQRRLTQDPAVDADPAFSRDGTRLAFTSTRDGNPEIYVMADDGSAQTRLTFDPAADQQADWSPDGTRIAFESTRNGNHEIYTMNPDGGAVTRLTFSSEFAADPSWHPDGASIAFVSGPRGAMEVFTVRPGSDGRTQLTRGIADVHHPAWSPDGQQIAFTSGENTLVMRADARETPRVAAYGGSDAAWGPLPPPSTPEFRKTMNVAATTGTAFVRMQGTAAAAPLRPEDAGEIPIGSARCGSEKPASTCTVIDTSQGGEVEIEAATTANERSTTSVAVSQGRATLSQDRAGVTVLRLPPQSCGAPPNRLRTQTPEPAAGASATSARREKPKKKKKKKKWKTQSGGNDLSTGQTDFTTIRSCRKTTVRVREGVVEVTVHRTGRSLGVVRKGQPRTFADR